MFFKCIVLLFVASVAWARSAPTNLNEIPQDEARSSETSSSYLSDLRYVYKVYQECSVTEFSPCLKLKLVGAMDRAFRSMNEVPIIDGISFIKDAKATVEASPKTEADLEATLPRALADREEALNSLISEKLVNFFDTHSLQVKLPSSGDLQRSLSDEGRGKKKRMGGLILIPLILGGTLVPLALGALALLAGKALIVSKLALLLAGIIGLKKLLGGNQGGGHESAHEVVVGGGGGHSGGGWGRSYEKEQAQKLAYAAYQPAPVTTTR